MAFFVSAGAARTVIVLLLAITMFRQTTRITSSGFGWRKDLLGAGISLGRFPDWMSRLLPSIVTSMSTTAPSLRSAPDARKALCLYIAHRWPAASESAPLKSQISNPKLFYPSTFNSDNLTTFNFQPRHPFFPLQFVSSAFPRLPRYLRLDPFPVACGGDSAPPIRICLPVPPNLQFSILNFQFSIPPTAPPSHSERRPRPRSSFNSQIPNRFSL